jgi:hypothetical protein
LFLVRQLPAGQPSSIAETCAGRPFLIAETLPVSSIAETLLVSCS